jgi:hypothetical protein
MGAPAFFVGERRLLMWPDSIKLFDNSPFLPGGGQAETDAGDGAF